MFPIKTIEDLKSLNKLTSLQNQVQTIRLKDKLGKQNFHEDTKKVFEPVTKSIKDVSQEVTKTMAETFIKSSKAIENLNDKLLEILNDRGLLASYLMSPLSKSTNPEKSTQFKLVKDSSSNRIKDLLIHKTIPITLHDNLLTFRESNKKFELKGDLLKKITNKNYNVDLASLQDKKLLYEPEKERNFM